MWIKTGVHEGRRHHRHGLPHVARRRRLRHLRRGLDLLHRRAQPGDLQDAGLQVRGRARLHQQAAVRPQARPRHARSRASRSNASSTRRPSSSGLDPADMRRRISHEPFTKTANHLTVTTIGLGECIDKVVEASGWRDKRARFAAHGSRRPSRSGSRAAQGARHRGLGVHDAAPARRSTGTTCRTRGVDRPGRPQRRRDHPVRRHRHRPGLGLDPGLPAGRGAGHRARRTCTCTRPTPT